MGVIPALIRPGARSLVSQRRAPVPVIWTAPASADIIRTDEPADDIAMNPDARCSAVGQATPASAGIGSFPSLKLSSQRWPWRTRSTATRAPLVVATVTAARSRRAAT